jgi:hypothetical protein
LRLVSLLFLSLWSVVSCLSGFPFLDYLAPSCVHFPNYFKEGEETFCSLNVYFSWGMLGGADCYRGRGGGILKSWANRYRGGDLWNLMLFFLMT